MKAWRVPPDFWIAIEKVINHHASHTLRRDKEDMPPELYIPRYINELHLGR
jgi:hypothetical protein